MNIEVQWKERLKKIAFWAINIGLLLIVLISVTGWSGSNSSHC
jgi:nitric oxide reductase large subunit